MSFGQDQRSMGTFGGEFVSDTNAHTGDWCAMQVITATVISAITMPDVTNESALTGETLAANTLIRGRITSITLTSGKVQLFKTN